MSSGHYCDGCAQAYYKCVCNKPQEKVKEQTIKMNQRIKQLAEQAGLKVESFMTNPPKPFQILGSTEQFEKFAELIVRQCADIADSIGEHGYIASEEMLEQFGVK